MKQKKRNRSACRISLLLTLILVLSALLPAAGAAQPNAENRLLHMEQLLQDPWTTGKGYLENGSLVLPGGSIIMAYRKDPLPRNFTLEFQLKLELLSPLQQEEWAGFVGFRCTNPGAAPWAGGHGYYLMLQEHQVLLQRWSAGGVPTLGSYDLEADGQVHSYELQCEDTAEGVHVVLTVDGRKAMDVVDLDRDGALKQDGHLKVMNHGRRDSDGQPVAAVTVIGEPGSDPAPNPEKQTLKLSDLLQNGADWNLNGAKLQDGTLMLPYGGIHCPGYQKTLPRNFSLEFKLNVQWKPVDGDRWGSFMSFRDTMAGAAPWIGHENNRAYYLRFDPDGISLQRWVKGAPTHLVKANQDLNNKNNTYVLDCEDVENGVHIVLKLNGVTVIDYLDLDADGALKQDGSVMVMNHGMRNDGAVVSQVVVNGEAMPGEEIKPDPVPELNREPVMVNLEQVFAAENRRTLSGLNAYQTEWNDGKLVMNRGAISKVGVSGSHQNLILDFKLGMEWMENQNDWGAIVTFRDTMPELMPWDVGKAKRTYGLMFLKDSVQLKRWDSRDFDANPEDVGGEGAVTTFALPVDGNENLFRLICRDVQEGVEILLYVNGTEAMHVVDASERAIRVPGALTLLGHGKVAKAVFAGVPAAELPDYAGTPAPVAPRPLVPALQNPVYPAEEGTATEAANIKETETTYYLENDRIKVGIDKLTGYVRSVSNKAVQQSCKVEDQGAWPFRLLLQDGSTAGIWADTKSRVSDTTISQNGRSSVLTLSYDDLKTDSGAATGISAVVNFYVDAGDDYFTFDVNLANNGTQNVMRLDLCRGGSLRPLGDNPRMTIPTWGEMEYWDDPAVKFSPRTVDNPEIMSYPGPGWNNLEMGFVDISASQGGIGMAYINRQTMMMDFRVASDHGGMSVSPAFLNPEKLDARHAGECYSVPLKPGQSFHTDSMVIVAHDGDWHRTADVYREQFQEAFTVNGEPDYLTWETISPSLKDTDVMLRYHSWKFGEILPSIRQQIEMWGVKPVGEPMLWLSGYNEHGYGHDVPNMFPLNPNQGTEEEFNAICDYVHKDLGGNLWLYEHPYAYATDSACYEEVKAADPGQILTAWDGVWHRNLCMDNDLVYNLWRDQIVPSFRNSHAAPDGLQFDQGSLQFTVCDLEGHNHGLDPASMLSSHTVGLDNLAKLVRSNLTKSGETAYVVSEGFCDLTCRHIDMAQTRWDSYDGVLYGGNMLLGGRQYVFPQYRIHNSAVMITGGKHYNMRQLGAIIGGVTCLNDGGENTPENCGEYLWFKNEMRRENAPGYPYNFRDDVGLTWDGKGEIFNLIAKVFSDGNDVTVALWNNTKQAAKETIILDPAELGLPGEARTFEIELAPNQTGYILYNTGTGEIRKATCLSAEPIEDVGRSLSLEDELFINNYASFTGWEESWLLENGGMLIWKEPVTEEAAVFGSQTAVVKEGLLKGNQAGQYGQRTDGIPARSYGDTLYLRLYVQNSDGTYAYGPLTPCSVRSYCMEAIKKNAAVKETAIELLHFGAAAQTYFDYRTETPANAELAPGRAWDPSLLTPLQEIPAEAPAADGTVVLSGRSLSLDGRIMTNFYFKPVGLETQKAELLVWNGTETSLTEAAAVVRPMVPCTRGYTAQARGFAAREYGDTVFVQAKLTDKSGAVHYSEVVAYSPEAYAGDILARNNNAPLMETVRQMVLYGEAAAAYFGSR